MPRYVLGLTKTKASERIEKAQRYRVFGYREWIDPFPSVGGTLPEKMVYAALSYRGIPFWSQVEVSFAIPELDFLKDYRPDFVIPSLRLIIEVQGAYWHSMPKTIESDSFKFAVYQQTGWRVLAWWDFDIFDNLPRLFYDDPQLSKYPVIQNFSSQTSNGRQKNIDDSKGIVTMNKRRGARLLYRKKAAGVRLKKAKTYGAYSVYGK